MSKKDNIKPIRFSDEQIEVIERAATKRKRTLTDWIRWCAVEASERVMGVK